ITPFAVESSVSKFDLALSLAETQQGLRCTCEYSTDLFNESSIARMLTSFQTLLKGIVQNPQAPISDLPLLTESEREQLLLQWNATQVEYPSDVCVHQLFESQVEQTPDAVAVVFDDVGTVRGSCPGLSTH